MVEFDPERQFERWIAAYDLWHASEVMAQIYKRGERLNETMKKLKEKYLEVHDQHQATYSIYTISGDERDDVLKKTRIMYDTVFGALEKEEEELEEEVVETKTDEDAVTDTKTETDAEEVAE